MSCCKTQLSRCLVKLCPGPQLRTGTEIRISSVWTTTVWYRIHITAEPALVHLLILPPSEPGAHQYLHTFIQDSGCVVVSPTVSSWYHSTSYTREVPFPATFVSITNRWLIPDRWSARCQPSEEQGSKEPEESRRGRGVWKNDCLSFSPPAL